MSEKIIVPIGFIKELMELLERLSGLTAKLEEKTGNFQNAWPSTWCATHRFIVTFYTPTGLKVERFEYSYNAGSKEMRFGICRSASIFKQLGIELTRVHAIKELVEKGYDHENT